MSLGSYPLGVMVRIPLQVTEGHIPAEAENVRVDKIYKPDLSLVAGFPKNMKVLDIQNSVYYYDLTPTQLGNYVVIMSFYVSSRKYSIIEHFSVQNVSSSGGQLPVGKPSASPVVGTATNPSAEAL
ncbi:hypothetical protein N9W84_00225 [bacterium]|nr:hypothetical protein [bacterium]